ncbi:FadD3 family acyl-CoA ligase [Thauera butanivorans]|uniref:FadD3 family acyl-CoA ligase n=1 Tax=Thauera butanivorans TaxID=86174 RepID=UPI0008398450|nr:FadD3 family acyl-CoA ligase [Thauera butanivorans]
MTEAFVPPLARSLPALVLEAAARHGERIFIEDGDTRIDYAGLPARVFAVSRALIAHGIDAGDRVAIWAPNRAEWIIAALGIHCAGAAMVPINTRMKGAEAADIIGRSGSRILFVVDRFLDTDYPVMLAGCRPPTLEKVVAIGQAGPHADTDWAAFLASGEGIDEAQARARAEAVRPGDISDLMFTSGTTGRPKGVMSAHHQVIQAFTAYVQIAGIRAGDRYLIVNPFFHTFGYKAGWVTCLIAGATVLPHPVFDAEAVFRRIEADRISVLPGPPTLYLSMLAHPGLAQTDLSSLRVAVTGASTIPPVLIERMRRELGFDVVLTAYGLTECGGLASCCEADDDAETVALTSGHAIPGTELRIVDAGNRPLAAGETGEICLRGFHVMQGYFQDDKATAETIDTEGWLHTGDVGTLDARGYLRITDRLKDMFIVGGFNCYPAEIEAALTEHPAIAQVAVIGVPDERMGEVGCACVVPRPGQMLDEAGLIAWSRERMANYKVPRLVRLFDALPVNASNKVDKNALRAQLRVPA